MLFIPEARNWYLHWLAQVREPYPPSWSLVNKTILRMSAVYERTCGKYKWKMKIGANLLCVFNAAREWQFVPSDQMLDST